MKALAIWLLLLLIAASAGQAAPQPPIRVGFVAPMTGVFAPTGRDLSDGFTLYLEQTNRQLGGRPVNFIVEDDQLNPAVGVTKVRKLVESDQVHLLTGIISSATAYAVQQYVDTNKVPTVISVAAADDFTQRRRAEFAVRTGWGSSSQAAHPFGEYAFRQLGFRRVVTLADDFAFGHEWVGGFQRTFEEAGGQVVRKIWAPLGTADFSPFLAQVPRDVDAVVGAVVGPVALRFLKQYAEFGLKDRLPLIGPGHVSDEINLPQLGDEAVGMINVLHYSAALDTPANRRFVGQHTTRYTRLPSAYSDAGYVSALWIDRALQRIGGRVEDKAAFMQAMRALVIADAPRGSVRLDAHGNVVENIYVRRVERVGGRLQNTVVHTFPTVSQFWRYEADGFLRQPLYSRDFPPCRHC